VNKQKHRSHLHAKDETVQLQSGTEKRREKRMKKTELRVPSLARSPGQERTKERKKM